jgi:CBS domain-containing protein
MPIERLIKRPVQSLPPEASCADAARMMREANVGSVVVTRDGRPLGVVTDRDLAVRVVAEGQDPERLEVGEIMSGEPIFLAGERDIPQLIAAMRDLGVRRIPIVDDEGLLCGIVSLDDLLLLLADQLGGLAQCIRREIEGS